MDTAELIKKVRRIEIRSRGLSNQIFSGHYHSVFKGMGMAFSEVREYLYGDDIRSIDWNVTARFNHPYVKIFEEERELTVVVMIDVSGSNNFGSTVQRKRDIISEIAAVLAFSAIQNNDKVGAVFFSDHIEKFIPPKKGKQHIMRIIRELVYYKPQNNKTNISEPLRFLTNAIKKRCTAFILSDFLDKGFDNALKIVSRKHDIIALNIYDRREMSIPAGGLLFSKDAETGNLSWIDTSNVKLRKVYSEKWAAHQSELDEKFMKAGVDYVSISTSDDYVQPLLKLFKKREARF
jgi:uncharacterized protein (DUF58 family)